MSTQPRTFLTPEQYLEIERAAERKSEYYDGQMFLMAGASYMHVVIEGNITGELRYALKRKRCTVCVADLRVRIPATGLFTYPDVSIVCDAPEFAPEDPQTILNPTVIVEVLSPSTESYDRGKKFAHYRQIPSLKEYLLVSQDEIRVDQFIRQPDDVWSLRSHDKVESNFDLPSINCTLALREVYDKTHLLPNSPPR